MKLAAIASVAGAAFVARTIGVTLQSGERISRAHPSTDLPPLSIVVPARNEERQIEECVRSLLGQRYADFEVIVVDDRSQDATLQILDRIAQSDERLRVVRGEDLPEGWIGKPWALEQGAREARGRWLLFTDADTLHDPDACASAMSYALSHDLQILSLLPTQVVRSAAERIMLPTILWTIAFAVGSLRAINDPARKDAAIFNGQYLLFDRRAYDALGGHAAVRDRIAEDYELARMVKQAGRLRSRLAGASELVSTRMYRSAGEIWHGFSKNLFVAAADRPAQAFAGIAMLAALSPLPEFLLLRALRKRRYLEAAGMAACIGATASAAEFAMRRSKFPRGSGAFFPIGVAGTIAIFLNSALAHRTGRVSWRGRRYGHRRRTSTGSTQTSGAYGNGDANGTS